MQADQQSCFEDIFNFFFEYSVEIAEHIPHKFLNPHASVYNRVPRWITTTNQNRIGETKRTTTHHMVR
jgi:hypothetical protein